MSNVVIEGQLNPAERQLLTDSILKAPKKPAVVVEVGTWLGGGSTMTFLRALHQNGAGHLWGVEANRSIYDRMMANLSTLGPEILHHFTPLFGMSDQVLPRWIAEQKKPFQIDVAFLDGGDRPGEQIAEFEILNPYMPVGAQLMSHDAKCRKGKWLVPFMSHLDNWQVQMHDISEHGLMTALKIAPEPSSKSLREARSLLTKLYWEPMEVLARWTPGGFKKWVFSRIPKRLAVRIAGGQK